MSIRVYHRDLNPAIDPFSYRCSNSSAQSAVMNGEGEYITLPDGRTAVHLFRRRADRENWIERLEAQASAKSAPMGLLHWEPPKNEAWLLTMRTSGIPNVRSFAAAAS